MNELDQFVKHNFKVKHYARYTDDFVIISENRNYLEDLIPKLRKFLLDKLKLEIHPHKLTIKKYNQGVDFLGCVLFPHYSLLRTKTRKRILKKIKYRTREYKLGQISESSLRQSLQSYLGALSHANSFKLGEGLRNQFWFWLSE